MSLEFGGAGALVKAFLPTLMGLAARTTQGLRRRHASDRRPSSPIVILSPEARAALATLDLPPDGPMHSEQTLRARLTPDVAARNFVSWARALDLTGAYSRRRIYALYCEFSEVDARPPLRDTRFLEALAEAEGIRKEQVRIGATQGKSHRVWRWTIEPAKIERTIEVAPVVAAQIEIAHAEPAPVPPVLIGAKAEPPAPAPVPLVPEMPAAATAVAATMRSARPIVLLPRFVADQDHPFSPAGLREREKNARRERLYAAASRKQRGAVRRAA